MDQWILHLQLLGLSMGKGGARHFTKPYVDAGILLKTLEVHSKLVTNLGPYESISKNQGCSPKGLLHCLPLVKGLLELQPSAEIHSSSLRTALYQLLMAQPSVNDSKFNGSVWVNLRIDRITALLYHIRRLKSSDDLRSCASQLTSAELMLLQGSLDLVENKKPDQKTAEAEGSLAESKQQEEKAEAEASLAKRKLKEELTNVSLDSDGFPKCLGSEPSCSKQKEAASSSQALPKGLGDSQALPKGMKQRHRLGKRVALPISESSNLKSKMGFTSKQRKSLTKAQGQKKKKKSKPAPAAKEGQGTAGVWAKLKLTKAQKPVPRAYITDTLVKGEKVKLIVEISIKRSPNYLQHIETIFAKLETEGLRKQDALDERDRLRSLD